jgi:metallophosphoesterase (TIGR00282 family)
MNILFVSDIVGDPGRRVLRHYLDSIRREHSISLVVANGENAAGGFGITPRIADEIMALGVDVITTGNHVWDKKEIVEHISQEERLIRPANFPPGVPGNGSAVVSAGGASVGVLNLMGRVFLANLDCPFRRAREEVRALREKGVKVILVDFHAEATSEKIAFARFMDGSVTAVVGTHTHVQTADEQVLPKGTAYITDVGMTGPHDSVIGVTAEIAIERFLFQTPKRFDTAKGPGTLQAVVISADPETGRSTGITRLSIQE